MITQIVVFSRKTDAQRKKHLRLVLQKLQKKIFKPSDIAKVLRMETLDKGFNGTVVNRTLLSLHGGFLEITRTVPLILDQVHEQFPVFFCNISDRIFIKNVF